MALNELGGTEFEPYDYQSSIRRRLQTIGSYGEGEAQRIAMAQQLASARDRANEMSRLSSMNPVGQYQDYGGPQGGGSFNAFLRAISGQESGGNYSAQNRDSGAMGKYQIMPANIMGTKSGWDYEILGRDINIADFLNNPALQEKIAQGKLQQYYNKYGAQGAAAAWYGGEGVARNWNQHTGAEGRYPSIANYVKAIMARMGL